VTPYFQAAGCTIHHADCLDLLPGMSGVDHMIADPPYSARTHAGHNRTRGMSGRRGLDYEPWTPDHAWRLAYASRLSIPGWRVVMSDHVLQPVWEEALAACGLYVFAPVPYVASGSRVRMQGDGPACWTVWLTMARPQEQHFLGWGSLPGGYWLPKGEGERGMWVGGKPLWLARQLVAHYSREGQTVLDPVCGGGSVLLAALQLGRKVVGIDSSEQACQASASRVERWLSDAKQSGRRP